jgi:hypothetical protein
MANIHPRCMGQETVRGGRGAMILRGDGVTVQDDRFNGRE